MFRRSAVLALTLLLANALTLFAADHETVAPSATPLQSAIARAARDSDPAVSVLTLPQTPKRPAALPALYGTYAALQVMDVMSTRTALAAGAQEGNPVMRPGNMAATIGMKAASGVATVYFVEKAWKKSRVGGILLMAAINGASAAVVAHNHYNARR